MLLSKGKVTQNGNWVSYKTDYYSESINFFQKCSEELNEQLEKLGILNDGDYHAGRSYNSDNRKNCVTVRVASTDPKMSVFPFEGDAVN